MADTNSSKHVANSALLGTCAGELAIRGTLKNSWSEAFRFVYLGFKGKFAEEPPLVADIQSTISQAVHALPSGEYSIDERYLDSLQNLAGRLAELVRGHENFEMLDQRLETAVRNVAALNNEQFNDAKHLAFALGATFYPPIPMNKNPIAALGT